MLLVSAQVVIGLAGGIYEDVSGLLVIRVWSLTFADRESSLCDKSNLLPAEPRKAGVEPVWFVDSEDVKEYTSLGLKARHISTPGVHWNKITCTAQTRELLLRFRGPCVPGRRAIKFGLRPTKDPTLLCVSNCVCLGQVVEGGKRAAARNKALEARMREREGDCLLGAVHRVPSIRHMQRCISFFSSPAHSPEEAARLGKACCQCSDDISRCLAFKFQIATGDGSMASHRVLNASQVQRGV